MLICDPLPLNLTLNLTLQQQQPTQPIMLSFAFVSNNLFTLTILLLIMDNDISSAQQSVFTLKMNCVYNNGV